MQSKNNRDMQEINDASLSPAVVLGGQVSGLAMVRALGKRGIPVIVIDSDPEAYAFASRYMAYGATVPDIVLFEQEAIEELLFLGRNLEKPGVLLPSSDQWMLAVARHAERLSAYYHVPASDYGTLIGIVDKRKLYVQSQEAGIPVPPYAEVSAKLPLRSGEVTFPCVVKPAVKNHFVDRFGQSAVRVNTVEELQQFIRDAQDFELIVQSMIPCGEDGLRTVAVYVDRHGELKACLHARRSAVYPLDVGTSCIVSTCESNELTEETARLLRHLNFRGVAELEYVYDTQDSTWKLIDMNPRFWKWIGLPVAAGVDLPWLAYSDAIGQPVEAASMTQKATWISMFDLVELSGGFQTDAASREALSRLLSVRSQSPVLSEQREPTVDSVFCLDDPLPVIRALANRMPSGKIACKC